MRHLILALAYSCLTNASSAEEKTLSLHYVESCVENVEHFDIIRGSNHPHLHAPHDNPNAFCYCIWKHIRPDFTDEEIRYFIARDERIRSKDLSKKLVEYEDQQGEVWIMDWDAKFRLLDKTITVYCDQSTREKLPAKPQSRFLR